MSTVFLFVYLDFKNCYCLLAGYSYYNVLSENLVSSLVCHTFVPWLSLFFLSGLEGEGKDAVR